MADQFHHVKRGVLRHVRNLFEEMEEQMAVSHEEKFALLEDAFENATDVHELRVAFQQWFAEHEEDLELDQNADELWTAAIAALEDMEAEEDDDEDEEEEEDDEDEKDEDK